MNKFHYWKKGQNYVKFSKKKPRGYHGTLLEYQIQNGEFDESPYMKMVEQNQQKFDIEIDDWKRRNENASIDAFNEWYIHRRKRWNKENFKLIEAYHAEEMKKILTFVSSINNEFNINITLDELESFGGSVHQFYNHKKQNTHENQNYLLNNGDIPVSSSKSPNNKYKT